MANADFTPYLTQETHPNPFNLQDLIATYTGVDDETSAAVTAATLAGRTAVIAALQAILDDAAFDPAFTLSPDLQAAIEAVRDTTVPTNFDAVNTAATTPIILTEIKTAYLAVIAADRGTPCPKCRVAGVGVGRHPSDGPGGASAVAVVCDMCAGFTNVTSDTASEVVVTYATDDTEYTT